MKLFLDDERMPDDVPGLPEGDWVVCRAPWELRRRIEKAGGLRFIEAISFDHDLGSGVPTGYEALSDIEEMCDSMDYSHVPDMYIHTMNPSGRNRMKAVLNRLWEQVDARDSEKAMHLRMRVLMPRR